MLNDARDYDYDLSVFNFDVYTHQEMVTLFNQNPRSVLFDESQAIAIEKKIARAEFNHLRTYISDEDLHVVKLHQFKLKNPEHYAKLMRFLSEYKPGDRIVLKPRTETAPQENNANRPYSLRQRFFNAGLCAGVTIALAAATLFAPDAYAGSPSRTK